MILMLILIIMIMIMNHIDDHDAEEEDEEDDQHVPPNVYVLNRHMIHLLHSAVFNNCL